MSTRPQVAMPPSSQRDRNGANRGANRERAISRTVTLRQTQEDAHQSGNNTTPPVLKLRRRRRVRWTTDTHNNEHDGKKSSKSCCIYHRPRNWDESGTESDGSGGEESKCEEVNGNEHKRDGQGNQARDNSGDDSSSSGGPRRRRRRTRHRVLDAPESDEDDGFFD